MAKDLYLTLNFISFVPSDNKLLNHYNHFLKDYRNISCKQRMGYCTARDNFVIDFERKKLEKRIEQFIDPKIDEDFLKQTYGFN